VHEAVRGRFVHSAGELVGFASGFKIERVAHRRVLRLLLDSRKRGATRFVVMVSQVWPSFLKPFLMIRATG